MTSNYDTKKQILKSSAIVGGASFLTILIGLAKVKVLAMLLGPTGIGLMGILTTIMSTGSTLFGMGLSTSGVRELALSNENIKKLSLVRTALFSANFILGLLAFFIILFFKENITKLFFQHSNHQFALFVIAVGVFFSLISSSQTTLLQGLRKIADLAKVKVFGALAATMIGLFSVWQFGESGVPFFVIVLPLTTSFVAFFYTRKLPKLTSSSISIQELKTQWQGMFSLGFAFMLTGLMGTGSQLIVRYIVTQELNIESVGYFQAAWQISMTYISFVLGSMAADYYPRLTQQIHDKETTNRMVNEQTEIAIILAAPVLLGMLTFAPLVIHLLYSSEFTESVEILRWQVFGDLIKIISWPLGFVLLAKGYSKLFFCTELLWNSTYVCFVYLGIGHFGIQVTGYAFVVSYFIVLLFCFFGVKKLNDFYLSKKNIKWSLLLIISCSILLFLSYYNAVYSFVFGLLLILFSVVFLFKFFSELGFKCRKLEKVLNAFKNIFNF